MESSKTILSFDVGITNLAYCILSNTEEIKCWNVINLLSGPNSGPETCQAKNKNGKDCSFKVLWKDNDFFTCKKHKRESSKQVKKKKVSKVPRLKVCDLLIEYLHSQKELFDSCDHIIIERQPGVNKKMGSIGDYIAAYFKTLNVIENRNRVVLEISAKNKLRIEYDGPSFTCTLKGGYSKRKFTAVKYAYYLIQDKDEWKAVFESSKKKDDLADCYLQCLWYIRQKLK